MSKRKLIIPICLMVAAISGVILGSGSVSASPSAGVEVSANIQEFLRMALDTNSLAFEDSEGNTTISPSPSGTLASGNVNVAVTTNTDKGFTISAYTHGATTDMTNTNTDLSASIPSVSTATGYDSTTGLSALPTDTWGFRKKTGENTYGNWFGVGTDDTHATVIENSDSSSSEYCSTLAYPLNTSGCSAGTYAEHTLNFGANLTPNLPAGTYTNDVVISAIVKSNGARYMLNFDSNGGQNTMASRSIITGSTFNLPATTNVTNGDYELSGFAFTSSATSPAYTPGQTVTVNDFLTAATSAGQDIDAGIMLYLIWQEPIAYMQEFSCTNDLSTGETMELVDKRDGSAYNIKKFSNGTCWMTSNLILGHDKGYALTNELTNIPSSDTSTYYFPMAGRRGSLSSASTIDSSNTSTPTFDSNYENQAQVQYRAQGQGGDVSSSGTLGQSTGYYNFWAASLGYSGYQYGSSSGNTPRDICPKGWQLPLGGSNTTKSWISIDKALNGSSAGSNRTDATARDRFLNDAGFLYSGTYTSSQLYYVGSNGYWWSSTVNGTNYSYLLILSSSGNVDPQGNHFKYNGFAVRCVAQ